MGTMYQMFFPFKEWDPAGAMPGFDYDVADETVFTQLKVKNRKIVVPGGITYQVLVLPIIGYYL